MSRMRRNVSNRYSNNSTMMFSTLKNKKNFAIIVSFVTFCVLFIGVFWGILNINLNQPISAVTGPVNTDNWYSDSTYYNTNWSGSGSLEDPYIIANASDLAGLAYSVNNLANNYTNSYFKQTADIDLSEHYWNPIGDSSRYFSGNYDGGSFTITGLFTTDSSSMYRGLFGRIQVSSNNIEIKNINIKDSIIYGATGTGGIVGHVSFYNNSYNFKILNCNNYAEINGYSDSVGGIVGYIGIFAQSINIEIENCKNYGAVNNNLNSTGGILGCFHVNSNYTEISSLTINDCSNEGYIKGLSNVGGIIGYFNLCSSKMNITNCFNSAKIEGQGNLGGLLGSCNVYNSSNISLSIESCYNIGESITGTGNCVGGIVGYINSGTASTSITIANTYNTSLLNGSSYVGGIVGEIYSYINSTTSTKSGSFSSLIKNSYNTGNIQSSSPQAYSGGIVGYLYQYSYATGALIGSNVRSARSQTSITSCFNVGNISNTSTDLYLNYMGGILGNSYLNVSQGNYGTASGIFNLQNCYNLGNISGQNLVSNTKGGIIGYNQATGSNSSRVTYSTTITNNYYGGACPGSMGGISGADSSGHAEFKQMYVSSFKTESFYEDISNWQPSAMWDFNFYWKIVASENNGFPILMDEEEKPDSWIADESYYDTNWKGQGTEGEPYLIEDAADLAGLAYAVYSGTATVVDGNFYYQNIYFKQTNHIDLSAHWWQPIGTYWDRNGANLYHYFAGNYNGDNFTISGIFTPSGIGNAYSNQGLFGYTSGAKLENIIITNGKINGYNYVGGIVGNAGATQIINCSFSGTVLGSQYVGGISGSSGVITNSVNSGTIGGESYIGGIVGNTGDVNACYNKGQIFGAVEYAGGITGAEGTISNCYNVANINGVLYVGGITGSSRDVSNSYNLGEVSGTSSVGGIAGIAKSSSYKIVNCFNLGNVIASNSKKGGIVGDVNDSDKYPLEQILAMNFRFLYNNYYGGNCENIGGILSKNIEGVTYSETLQDDAKNIDFYLNDNNWQLTYLWDFDFAWSIDGEQNNGYPILTGNLAKLVTVLSFNEGLLETEGWHGPLKSITESGYVYTLSKWITPGQELGELPKYTTGGDLTFDNYYTSLNDLEQNLATPELIIEQNTTIYALWDLTSTWLDYKSSGLQKQGEEYLITSAEDLAFVSYEVSQGNSTYINASYIQTDDIDLTSHYWVPIGDAVNKFAGNYDGGGFDIVGINTYRIPPALIEAGVYQQPQDYVGLFGYILNDSVDSKSTVQNVNISSGDVKGIYVAGAIAGYAENVKFENCINNASVLASQYCAGIVGICKNSEIITCANYAEIGAYPNNMDLESYSSYAGGIVCYLNNSSIFNCFNKGVIKAGGAAGIAVSDIDENSETAGPSTIDKCYNEGEIYGSLLAGGIVGSLSNKNIQSSLKNCYNTATISALVQSGGIAGGNYGIISNVYNTGKVLAGTGVGGIVGLNYGLIINSFNVGAVTSWGDSGSIIDILAGGIAGSGDSELITNCYYGGKCGNIGGADNTTIEGADYSSSIQSDAQSESWFLDSSLWMPEYPWQMGDVWYISDGYPTFEPPITWLDDPSYYDHELSGEGTQQDPYLITSNKELAGVAYLVLNYNSEYKNAYFKLTTNVDMSEYFWVPIGTSNETAFAGHFDGGNYTISGLKIYSGWDGVGLFGTVIGTKTDVSDVKNVIIEDASINAIDYAGGIVGVGEYIQITNSKITGENIIKANNTGGIIGYAMNSTITDCHTDANIYAEGDFVGGILGFMYNSVVDNAYSTIQSELLGKGKAMLEKAESGFIGGVIGGAELSLIKYCFNSGKIEGTWGMSMDNIYGNPLNLLTVGGVVGYLNNQSNISNCYNLGSATGDVMTVVGGVVGKSNDSVIENCYNNGNFTMNLETTQVLFAGGVVGAVIGTEILNCINYADFNLISAYIGGVVCSSLEPMLLMMGGADENYVQNLKDSTVDNCINYGNINAIVCSGIICMSTKTSILNSNNLGIIGDIDFKVGTQSECVAGICAMVMQESVFDNCYNYEKVYGYRNAGGIIGWLDILTKNLSSSLTINHCFNSGNIILKYGRAGGLIAQISGSSSSVINLQITNSASICDIIYTQTNDNNDNYNIGGIIGTVSNLNTLIIQNCLIDISILTANSNFTYLNAGGITYSLNVADISSSKIENCAIKFDISNSAGGVIEETKILPWWGEANISPEEFIKNSYALVTNKTTNVQTNVVIEDGGMDGNFGYMQGLFNNLPVPKNIYLVEDYLTQTGIFEYLQTNFGVEKIA